MSERGDISSQDSGGDISRIRKGCGWAVLAGGYWKRCGKGVVRTLGDGTDTCAFHLRLHERLNAQILAQAKGPAEAGP